MKLLILFLAYAAALSAALARRGIRSPVPSSPGARGPRIENVLIVGATGGTGRQLVAQALERGYMVTALVRCPAALASDHPRLRIVRGDVMDPVSLGDAMAGQQAVVCALGHKRYFFPTRILSEGTQNILSAMEARGVRRLVCETALGLGDSAFRMGLYYTCFVIPAILPFYFWDKTRQERVIQSSRASWIVVRPGALTSGERRGRVRHGHDIGSRLWTVRISRADVADFMLNQLESDTYVQSAPGLSW
jgi:putative NADH-flavin reductase